MYQHILAAIDDSATSDRALQEAIGLAKDMHAKLRIVYVVDEVTIYNTAQLVDPTEIERVWIEIGHEILNKAQRLARSAGIDAEVELLETEIIGERMADAIVGEAKAWPADLVVAGTHGRSGLNHLLMGSVAEGIVRICPVPVLLVRDRQPNTAH
ncbi:MAG: universal stress protein [Gallionellaceae bacterium]